MGRLISYGSRIYLRKMAHVSCHQYPPPYAPWTASLTRFLSPHKPAHTPILATHLDLTTHTRTHATTHTPSCLPQGTKGMNWQTSLASSQLEETRNVPWGTRWLCASIERRRKLILLIWRSKWISWKFETSSLWKGYRNRLVWKQKCFGWGVCLQSFEGELMQKLEAFLHRNHVLIIKPELHSLKTAMCNRSLEAIVSAQ